MTGDASASAAGVFSYVLSKFQAVGAALSMGRGFRALQIGGWQHSYGRTASRIEGLNAQAAIGNWVDAALVQVEAGHWLADRRGFRAIGDCRPSSGRRAFVPLDASSSRQVGYCQETVRLAMRRSYWPAVGRVLNRLRGGTAAGNGGRYL